MMMARVKHVNHHGEVIIIENDPYFRPESRGGERAPTKKEDTGLATKEPSDDTDSEDGLRDPEPQWSSCKLWWYHHRNFIIPLLNIVGTFGLVVTTVLLEALPANSISTSQVFQNTSTVLTMSDFTFGMWGLVMATGVVFSVYSALRESRGDLLVVDTIGSLYFIACIFNIVTWVSWHYDTTAAAVFSALSFVIAAVVYFRIGVNYGPHGRVRQVQMNLPTFVWYYQRGLLFYPYDPITTKKLDTAMPGSVLRDKDERFTVDLGSMTQTMVETHEKTKVRKVDWRTEKVMWSWTDGNAYLHPFDWATSELLERTTEKFVTVEDGEFVVNRERMTRMKAGSEQNAKFEQKVTRQEVHPPRAGASRALTMKEYWCLQVPFSVLLAWSLFVFFACVITADGSTTYDIGIAMTVLLGFPCGVLGAMYHDAAFCFVMGWCMVGVSDGRWDDPGIYAPARANGVQALMASVCLVVYLLYDYYFVPQREDGMLGMPMESHSAYFHHHHKPAKEDRQYRDGRGLWQRIVNKPMDAPIVPEPEKKPKKKTSESLDESEDEGFLDDGATSVDSDRVGVTPTPEAAPAQISEEKSHHSYELSEADEMAQRLRQQRKEMRAVKRKFEMNRIAQDDEIAMLKERLAEVEAQANNLIAVLEYEQKKKNNTTAVSSDEEEES